MERNIILMTISPTEGGRNYLRMQKNAGIILTGQVQRRSLAIKMESKVTDINIISGRMEM